MESEPSDDDLVAGLRDAPAGAWDALRSAAAALDTDHDPVSWTPSQQRTEQVGGEDRVVHTVPYPTYSDRVLAVVHALTSVGAVTPFDWMAWLPKHPYPGGAGLDGAPVADAVRLATAIVRSERFGDGNIAGALESGALQAVILRLLRWYDTER